MDETTPITTASTTPGGMTRAMSAQHELELRSGSRFDFGRNWLRFLRQVDRAQIEEAETELRATLGSLENQTFLDIGCGSGLSSLAAYRLGARVHSFDFDPMSVACTQALKRRWAADATSWTIEEGSILDPSYIASLGTFDVVYSWGVLHHTGHMHDAFERAASLVSPGGRLMIAIYNDQGWRSDYWRWVKRQYNRSAAAKILILGTHVPTIVAGRYMVRFITGRVREAQRGMSLWYDAIDWLGGFPFEVASTEHVKQWFERRGLHLIRLRDVGRRSGCNEFVFRNESKQPIGSVAKDAGG